jgi:Flp pilus assembly CpaE family ATPase
MKHSDETGAELLSVALIGPNQERRTVVAKALDETRRTIVREFDSYPPERDHLQRLLSSFEVIVVDLDSDPDSALDLVERASGGDSAPIIVYSEKNDPKVAMRFMRAGAREFVVLPLEHGMMAEALVRCTTTPQEQPVPTVKTDGKLLVFTGSKGGSGVTTVACNVAIALAQRFDQKVLLIDLALPIGDAALCLGISAGYSTEDALRNHDRLDASLLQNLLERHRSGVFVLAAPTKVPEVEVTRVAIRKLISIARHEFDQVIVDVGSRIDVGAKALFEDAATIYLVSQTGISELRNSNRLISQFFAEGGQNLEIVINRAGSRFQEQMSEDVISKALGKPVRWKIPDDQDAARALQYGDIGIADTRISRISLEMGSSITGRPIPQEKKRDVEGKGSGRAMGHGSSGREESASGSNLAAAEERTAPTVAWPTPDPIAYGDKLTFAQLNAEASVDGTFVYTPGPGYVLPVGTHTLWVTFTPADLEDYTTVQAAVSIVVGKATPALTWPTPDTIIYGAALDEGQLSARAPVPGKFEYSPAKGEVLAPGSHALEVTFIPTDTANYTTAQATVTLNVARARSTIVWPAPESITYGTQLSGAQLCASSQVQGTLEYNPGLGAVLAAGEHKLSVVFTPADTLGYSTSQASVSLKVTKAAPAVTWTAPEPITQGTALSAEQLNATAAVPGTFVYSPATGEILRPGVHELSVTFTPTDALNYTTARATVSLTIIEKTPSVITWPSPSAISYGTTLSDAQLNATSEVPGTFVYTPSAGHVLAPGRYSLSVMFTPTDTEKYAAAHASVVLEVEGLDDHPPATVAPQESAFTWSYTAVVPSASEGAPVEGTGESAEMKTSPRETRTYKGAVYEKGEDGQWHLKKS